MITIKTYKGSAILPFINRLAELRIAIFREYPYLYDGNLAYEEKYLKIYADCPESVMVIIFDDEQIVGASTAVPLTDENQEMKQPFIDHDIPINTIFYLGESLLLPSYRGKNLYRHFFAEREQAAREYGADTTAFCAVKRDTNDPRKPADYKPLNKVWEHFGYHEHPELCAYFEWQEIDEATSSAKPLTFWLKKL